MPVDPYATSVGMASRTVLVHLLKSMIAKGVITRADADQVLRDAEQELLAHNTEVAAGGAGAVRTIRDGLDKP